MPQATVTFRDEEKEVSYVATIEDDVNAFIMEWGFVGLSPDDHDALNLTGDEEQAIVEQLWQHYDDYDPCPY